MNNRTDSLTIFAASLVLAAIPFVAKSDPMNPSPSTQSAGVPGGQTPNGQSTTPNQITNRDTNQPALRQKQEINNTSPDFPTAMNPRTDNPPATQPAAMPATASTTQRATTRTSNPRLDAANDAVQKAQGIYDHERQKVIAALQKKPDFQAALAQRDAASAKIPSASPTTGPSQNILNAATAKLGASQAVSELQERAIAADPIAAAAKKNLERAIKYRNRIANPATTRP